MRTYVPQVVLVISLTCQSSFSSHRSRASRFVAIAKEHYAVFEEAYHQILELRKTKCYSEEEATLLSCELSEPQELAARSGMIVIAFVAFAVEALIYDYGARWLTQGFVKKYLDKLDTQSKWIIYPQLKTGQAVPTGDNAFARVGKLIADRHQLVHEKSRAVTAESIAQTEDQENEFFASVHNAFLTLNELSALAKHIDPTDTFFSKHISTGP